ncbi:MAG: MFS transporter [Nitrososphaera sp.]
MAVSPLSLIRQSPRQHGWAWYLIPLNACGNGFGLYVPLYLLQLGGSVIEVALAAFLTGIANTIGSFVWGKLIDSFGWRATAVMISALSTLSISIITYFVSDISSVTALWTLLGFLTAGGGPATNLLIMQRSRREDWSDTFSWTSLISNGGIVIGMVVGFLWLAYSNDVHSYALACSLMSASAAAIVYPVFKRERAELRQRAASSAQARAGMLQSTLRSIRNTALTSSALLSSITSAFWSSGKDAAGRHKPLHNDFLSNPVNKKQLLFFAGVGFFFLSGNLFYTPYTPYLKANGISDSQVFLAYTVLTVSKVLFLPFNSRIVAAAGGEQKMAKLAYIPRTAGTAVAIVGALFAIGNPNLIFDLTLVAFVSVDVAFSIWSITTTSSLMQMVPSGKAGKIFGINQAVTGLGLVSGSIAGGETASQFGYPATFMLAIAALAVSVTLVSSSFRKAAAPLPRPEIAAKEVRRAG